MDSFRILNIRRVNANKKTEKVKIIIDKLLTGCEPYFMTTGESSVNFKQNHFEKSIKLSTLGEVLHRIDTNFYAFVSFRCFP